MDEQVKVPKSESDTDADDDNEEGLQSVEPTNEKSEFADTELEELVLKEGLQQILQLTLQDQADDLMREEISDSDDYADWIQWVSDAKRGEPNKGESTPCAEVPTVLQVHQVNRKEAHPKQFASSADCPKTGTRWEEISQKIRVDHNLGEEKQQQLWRMLGRYQDVFAWNKRELGCCIIGEHSIDTQGLPPCKTSPARLSYWEETEVKRQIDVLVDLGKMRPSNSEYACLVTLPAKKDGSRHLCGDYRPLNAQTRRDMFPMPLIEDVIDQLDVAFVWDVGCEQAYQALKTALVNAPVLTRPDFKRTFWLDVDWSPNGVGAILSQKEGKFEKVIAYDNKSLTEAQRKFHPMEGECYALIWGVMHFRQYLHMKHFILRTDHKPL